LIDTTRAPLRPVPLGPVGVEVERRGDGTLILRSPFTLGSYPLRSGDRLLRWAQERAGQTFLAQRRTGGGDWRRVSYSEALGMVRALAQALLDRGLDATRPLAVISENSIEHGLLGLAAMHAGIPYAPISPAYSLLSTDHAKLGYILSILGPGAVFAGDGTAYAKAIAAATPSDALLITGGGNAGRDATPFAELLATIPTAAVDRAFEQVGADTVAKVLFTSGSTGNPKGVIITQRMWCSNQQMIAACLPSFIDTPPILVDWLPWNHVFGGNHNFGIVLHHGGTLYIDEGKPVPGLVERSIQNLREIAPTVYYNVPRGFEALVGYLEQEPPLRKRFFSRLQFMFYAGANLSQPVWEALDRLAVQSCGERILMMSSLGSTETAPFATCANWESRRAGQIGLPAPGVEVKLIPVQDKLEIRFRGPNITPGYWRSPQLTEAAFDEEGFYRMGDAVRPLDPEDFEKGLMFDGRVSEDFKLATGTWVSVGRLRARLIAEGAPWVQDVVIAGHDRDHVAAMIFLYSPACRKLCPELSANSPLAAYARHPAVREQLQSALDRMARESTGSATLIRRAVALEDPPSIDRHELTDKGSINQRAVITQRAAVVEELYATTPSPRTIVAER
jgi:feruloyl-CoA synthase